MLLLKILINFKTLIFLPLDCFFSFRLKKKGNFASALSNLTIWFFKKQTKCLKFQF